MEGPLSGTENASRKSEMGQTEANDPLRSTSTLHPTPEESAQCRKRSNATCAIRALDLTIQIPGLLKVAEPLVTAAFRKENMRILTKLKRYVVAQSPEARESRRRQ